MPPFPPLLALLESPDDFFLAFFAFWDGPAAGKEAPPAFRRALSVKGFSLFCSGLALAEDTAADATMPVVLGTPLLEPTTPLELAAPATPPPAVAATPAAPAAPAGAAPKNDLMVFTGVDAILIALGSRGATGSMKCWCICVIDMVDRSRCPVDVDDDDDEGCSGSPNWARI